MRSIKTAYLLWLPSLFGVAGIHRLYMGKIGTGILWLVTWGLGGIGTIYDAITMARQLRKLDEEETGQILEDRDYWNQLSHRPSYSQQTDIPPDTLEHSALSLAKQNGGYTTPSQLALEARISADRAKDFLDSLCAKGYADIRIRKNGLVVYVFPDFLRDDIAGDFETL